VDEGKRWLKAEDAATYVGVTLIRCAVSCAAAVWSLQASKKQAGWLDRAMTQLVP
jgi:hypothetical protein